MPVRRISAARFDTPTRTPEGYLRAPAFLARTGVLEYQRVDGAMQRELRLSDDVFCAGSLTTFDLKPLTRGHPATNLDSTTVRHHQVGVVAHPRRADDGEHVAADVVVMDADAIRAVEAGERELSCGYTCDLEPIPNGVHRYPDGSEARADFIQRNIRGNHVAIVSQGRAGPTAAIRLDAAGHAIPVRRTDSMKIKLLVGEDAYEIDEPTARRIQALIAEAHAGGEAEEEGEPAKEPEAAEPDKKPEEKKDAAEIERLRGENAALKAKLSGAPKADAERERMDAAVASRVELVARVAPVLGQEPAALAKKSEREIMTAALARLTPAVKLDGKSDDYVRAAFDVAIGQRTDSAAAAADVATKAAGAERVDDFETRIKKARETNNDAVRNAWKKKPAA